MREGGSSQDLRGVQGVVVFGSWAARHAGIPGHDPHDLDVMLIGAPSQIAANTAADELGRRLDPPVGLTVVSASEWEQDAVGVVAEIKAGPHLMFTAPTAGDTGLCR